MCLFYGLDHFLQSSFGWLFCSLGGFIVCILVCCMHNVTVLLGRIVVLDSSCNLYIRSCCWYCCYSFLWLLP